MIINIITFSLAQRFEQKCHEVKSRASLFRAHAKGGSISLSPASLSITVDSVIAEFIVFEEP